MDARNIDAQATSARMWRRAFALWLAIAVAESLHGVARNLWLLPVVGPQRAHQIGLAVACMLIFAIAWVGIVWVCGGRDGNTAQRLQIGLFWVVLMLGFEFALGIALGVPIARIAADYDPREGGLMLLGMAFLFLAPTLAAKARGLR